MPAAAYILRHRHAPKKPDVKIDKVDYGTVRVVHILANDQWWQFSYMRPGDTYLDISTLEFVDETGCEMWVHADIVRIHSMAEHHEIEQAGLKYLNWFYSEGYLAGSDYPEAL